MSQPAEPEAMTLKEALDVLRSTEFGQTVSGPALGEACGVVVDSYEVLEEVRAAAQYAHDYLEARRWKLTDHAVEFAIDAMYITGDAKETAKAGIPTLKAALAKAKAAGLETPPAAEEVVL